MSSKGESPFFCCFFRWSFLFVLSHLDTIHLSGIIYFFHHFAPFLGELNLEIALLHIRMLLLDLLDPLGHVCLQDALLSIDGADHNDTFWEMI